MSKVAELFGLPTQGSPNPDWTEVVRLAEIIQQVESKLSSTTLLTIAEAPPTPHSLENKAADPS